MPSASDSSSSSGAVTREMLFDLMVLARDLALPDAQIRVLCGSVTQENASDSVKLLRRLHASRDTSLAVAPTPSPPQSVVSFHNKFHARPFGNASSEAGAVICAETFHKLCKDDRIKLQRLSAFCPFTVAFQKCPHSDRCQLVHICWDVQCKQGPTCMFSHQVSPTCDSVFKGTRCTRTRKYVGDNNRCLRNHDYKVRLFMGAMRVSHELDFYGLREARSQDGTPPYGSRDDRALNDTTPSEEPDAFADWMASDMESAPTEHDEVATVAGDEERTVAHAEDRAVAEVKERNLEDDDRPQSLEGDQVPEIDLIIFS